VKAGLAIDDVVTHINDEPVSKDDLRRIREMMEHEGAVVRITATRDGRTLEAKLKLRRLV
jgi:S1-C subfamily serine protease